MQIKVSRLIGTFIVYFFIVGIVSILLNVGLYIAFSILLWPIVLFALATRLITISDLYVTIFGDSWNNIALAVWASTAAYFIARIYFRDLKYKETSIVVWIGYVVMLPGAVLGMVTVPLSILPFLCVFLFEYISLKLPPFYRKIFITLETLIMYLGVLWLIYNMFLIAFLSQNIENTIEQNLIEQKHITSQVQQTLKAPKMTTYTVTQVEEIALEEQKNVTNFTLSSEISGANDDVYYFFDSKRFKVIQEKNMYKVVALKGEEKNPIQNAIYTNIISPSRYNITEDFAIDKSMITITKENASTSKGKNYILVGSAHNFTLRLQENYHPQIIISNHQISNIETFSGGTQDKDNLLTQVFFMLRDYSALRYPNFDLKVRIAAKIHPILVLMNAPILKIKSDETIPMSILCKSMNASFFSNEEDLYSGVSANIETTLVPKITVVTNANNAIPLTFDTEVLGTLEFPEHACIENE